LNFIKAVCEAGVLALRKIRLCRFSENQTHFSIKLFLKNPGFLLREIMRLLKKIFTVIILLLTAVLTTGYIFPDNLPELKKLKNYSPSKLEYGKTTVIEFKKITPKIPDSNVAIYTDGISIIKFKPLSSDVYSSIRVGFKSNKLDWLEFNLAHDIHISKLLTIYGNPTDINKTANKNLDYYNYNFFNISVDKNNKFVKSITYFAKPSDVLTKTSLKKANTSINQKKKFFEKFPNLEPGVTTEIDFSNENPGLIPYTDDQIETNSVYVLEDELGTSGYYYEKAILKFENGLLTWINLIPNNLPLADCLKTIKIPYKKEAVDSTYDLYDFSKFMLVVDKKTKMVKSIGVFSKDACL